MLAKTGRRSLTSNKVILLEHIIRPKRTWLQCEARSFFSSFYVAVKASQTSAELSKLSGDQIATCRGESKKMYNYHIFLF
ncbi:hypothetical protein J2Z66_003759 [Paenibacillus eucommiae]|uniref:Uncharacterized protein n=1 Tax=Paenibacillus eucommiae TaxID=1355755 RepID=A0ABS4IX28_9BACL|nr:hypothetical protein [Paenibacillus eucommiae]